MPSHIRPKKKKKHMFQEFTPEERACISSKLSTLKDEGVTGDEATARAISSCAPEKSASMAALEAPEIPSYRAGQAEDGTWTIFDVPVFAAHSEQHGDDVREFNAEWLAAALERGVTRQREGYMAPLHVGHHGETGAVASAGKFRLTRVGPIAHGGEEVTALFADLVGIPTAVYRKIRQGQLSYRSVEILDVSRPEIDSLALLDDEVPFFRFPLLRVAEGQTQSTQLVRSAGPALAFTAAGHSTATLFKFQEQLMTTPAQTETGTCGAAPADDPTKKNAAEQVLAQIFQLLQGILGQDPEQSQQRAAPVEQPEPVAVGVTRSAKPVEAPEVDLTKDGEIAALKGRLEKLEGQLFSMDQQSKVETKAGELATNGYSNEQVTAFRGAAKEHGLKAALSYAAGMERMGPSDPPPHWTGEIHPEAPDSEEVATFAAQGPEALAEARELYRSYKRTKPSMSFKDYHAANTGDPVDFLAAKRA